MITYKNILVSIKLCENRIVTIIRDNLSINDDLISEFISDLESEYDIEYRNEYETYDIFGYKEKNIIIVNYEKLNIGTPKKVHVYMNNNMHKDELINRMIHPKTIIIVLRDIDTTTNTMLYGKLSYISSLILLFKNKKIKILKNHTSKNKIHKIITGILDINFLLRKKKLKTLIEKINK